MKMKKIAALVLALIMIVGALAACGKTKVNGRYRTYFSTMPPTLNRFVNSDTATSEANGNISAHLYDTMVTKDKKSFEYRPNQADGFPKQMDTEGKVWQVKVKKNLHWVDNTGAIVGDVNAYTFEYGFFACIDPIQLNSQHSGLTNSDFAKPVNAAEYRSQVADGTTVSKDDVGFKALDEYTIEVRTQTPVTEKMMTIWLTNVRPINKDLYEKGLSDDKTSTDYGTAVDKIYSNGPFYLTEWVPDGKMTFERNPNYVFADEIHIEGKDYVVCKETSTAIEMFKTGQLDRVSIAYTDWEQFEDDPRVHEYFNDSLMYMFINIGNPDNGNILGKEDFRLAMFYGIDRQKLADTLGVYPATRLCRRAVIGDNLTNTPFVNLPQNFVKTAAEAFDVAKANTYLDKALEASGVKSVSQSLLISETATHIKGACEIIMKQWEDYFKGKLTATIRPLPASQAQTARRWHEDDPTSFELALGSLLPSSTNVRNTFKYYISTYNPPRTTWSDPEYDRLYAEIETLDMYNENDIKKIVENCLAMEKMLIDKVIVNPVYERPEKQLFAENIHLPVDEYVVGWGFGTDYMTID